MSRDSSGTYTLPAGNPVVSGTTISTSWANNTLSDIADELTNSLDKGGRTTPTANLPMGGFKFTGLAAGSSAGQSVRYEQALLHGQTSVTGHATTADVFAAGTFGVLFTGTGLTVTAFPAGTSGDWKLVTFDGVNTLTHNGTSFELPSSTNITTAAGDSMLVRSKGATGLKVHSYFRATGGPVLTAFPDGSVSAPGGAFASDLDNGLYRIGTNNWAMAVGGVQVLEFGDATSGVILGGSGGVRITTEASASKHIVLDTPAMSGTTSNINLTTGDSSTGNGGTINLTGGAAAQPSASPGGINITGGANTSGGASNSASGNVTIRGGSYSAASNGVSGTVTISPGTGSASGGGDTGKVAFQVSDGAGGWTEVARVGNVDGAFTFSSGAGVPSITSGAGTGATVVGTNYGFTITFGTTPTATIVVDLGAFPDGGDPSIAAGVASYFGAAGLYAWFTTMTTSTLTIKTSGTPVAGEKLCVVMSYYN